MSDVLSAPLRVDTADLVGEKDIMAMKRAVSTLHGVRSWMGRQFSGLWRTGM